VTKRSDNFIQVYADLRQPATYVVTRNDAYLVDANGTQLERAKPAAYLDYSLWLPITGVDAPPPGIGNPWPGEDLAAGLALVETLNAATLAGHVPYRQVLTGVDVSRYHPLADGPLRLLTVQPPVEILWGRVPGMEVDLDARAEQKLAALAQVWERDGGFKTDADKPVIDVSARGPGQTGVINYRPAFEPPPRRR
jgi:hypothetical protein